MHGGQLHVVTVQGLFHHGLVQRGGVPSASVSMAAFCFSGHRQEQRAGAARQIGHVKRGREFVVAPVNARGPIVKDQPRQQRGRRNRGIVRASELGVGQERVEQPTGKVVPLHSPRYHLRP